MPTFLSHPALIATLFYCCLTTTLSLSAQQLTVSLWDKTKSPIVVSSPSVLSATLIAGIDKQGKHLVKISTKEKAIIRTEETENFPKLTEANLVPADFYANTHAAFFCRLERQLSKKINGHNVVFRLRGQE